MKHGLVAADDSSAEAAATQVLMQETVAAAALSTNASPAGIATAVRKKLLPPLAMLQNSQFFCISFPFFSCSSFYVFFLVFRKVAEDAASGPEGEGMSSDSAANEEDASASEACAADGEEEMPFMPIGWQGTVLEAEAAAAASAAATAESPAHGQSDAEAKGAVHGARAGEVDGAEAQMSAPYAARLPQNSSASVLVSPESEGALEDAVVGAALLPLAQTA